MAKVTFTNDDILRAKLVSPGWYPMVVKSYEQQQAGTDGSDLHVYSVVIEGDNPFKGVPVRYQISEKAAGMGIEFFEACGNEVRVGVSLEYEKQVGKHVEGFIQRGEYKGKPNNQVVSFRKPKSAA